jgi:hypothetical protein
VVRPDKPQTILLHHLGLVFLLAKLDRNSGSSYAVGVPFCTEGDSLCVVVSRACCPLPLPTKTVCTQPLIVTACPGIKCGGPEFGSSAESVGAFWLREVAKVVQ